MVYRPVGLVAVCWGFEMSSWGWGGFGVQPPHPVVHFDFQFVQRSDQKLGLQKEVGGVSVREGGEREVTAFSSYEALTPTATAVAVSGRNEHRDVTKVAGGEQELPNPTDIRRPSPLYGRSCS